MYIFYHELDQTSTGAAIVITNLIRGLTRRGENVVLINFLNGKIHKELSNISEGKLTVINNDEQNIVKFAQKVCSSDIIVTMHFYTIYRFFKKANPRLIFYCVNITSLPVANQYFGFIHFRHLTKKLVLSLHQKNSLLFIDTYSLKEAENQFHIKVNDPLFLPIPVEIPKVNSFLARPLKSMNDIHLTYVGRAADWKVYPVRKVIYDIQRLNGERNVYLHIVTDNAENFRHLIRDIPATKVRLQFHENLPQQQLFDFLLATSDFHFAMGTASLEGAKLGIPTILLDFSFSDFPENYRYNFLYNTMGYRVGTKIELCQNFDGYTMEELLSLLNNREGYMQLSQKSYDYVRHSHELHAVTAALANFSLTSTMHINDATKYLPRYWR